MAAIGSGTLNFSVAKGELSTLLSLEVQSGLFYCLAIINLFVGLGQHIMAETSFGARF